MACVRGFIWSADLQDYSTSIPHVMNTLFMVHTVMQSSPGIRSPRHQPRTLLKFLSFRFPPFPFVLLTESQTQLPKISAYSYLPFDMKEKKQFHTTAITILSEHITFSPAYSMSKYISYKSSIPSYQSKGLMFCLSSAYYLFLIPQKHQFLKTSSRYKENSIPCRIHGNQTAFS